MTKRTTGNILLVATLAFLTLLGAVAVYTIFQQGSIIAHWRLEATNMEFKVRDKNGVIALLEHQLARKDIEIRVFEAEQELDKVIKDNELNKMHHDYKLSLTKMAYEVVMKKAEVELEKAEVGVSKHRRDRTIFEMQRKQAELNMWFTEKMHIHIVDKMPKP